MNPSLGPSLDGFLRVHGLTLASFAGKSVEAALRMCGLDDRALANLGDAHRERSLVVRGALLDRLARAKQDPNPYPEEPSDPDEGDDNKGDDTPNRPSKDKSRKKAKPVEVSDDEVTAAEIKAGLPMTAAQILYCGRVRRGEIHSQSWLPKGGPQPEFTGMADPDPEYWRRVNLTARAILKVHYARKQRGTTIFED